MPTWRNDDFFRIARAARMGTRHSASVQIHSLRKVEGRPSNCSNVVVEWGRLLIETDHPSGKDFKSTRMPLGDTG